MGEPHLRPVEGMASASTPPPSGPNGSDTDASRPRRGPSAARPKHPVPTDRLKFPDTAVGSLIAACVASRGGKERVTAESQANLMGVSPATAPLNNTFFVSVGLLKKVGKGEYLPTELALQFQQKWSFDKAAAPSILAPAFRNSWFHEAVRQRVQVGRPTITQMVETLAGIAGTDSSYATQYRLLLSWLEYVGLIRIDGGVVDLVDDDGQVPQPVEVAPTPTPEETPQAAQEAVTPEDDLEAVEPAAPTPGSKGAEVPVLSLSFEVRLTADQMARLAPEHVAALFDVAGKVATVKAALRD